MVVPAGMPSSASSARPAMPCEVERQRGHLDLAVHDRPLLARAVAVDLDAVVLRIAQVERLADEVIRGAGELPAAVHHATQRPGELDSARHQQGQVEEAGAAGRTPRGVGVADQFDQRGAALGPEPDRLSVALQLRRPITRS